MSNSGVVILGNQLFPTRFLAEWVQAPVFMREDWGLCTNVRHHQQKIVLFLAAMREYADRLRARDFAVTYQTLEPQDDTDYETHLTQFVDQNEINELVHFEVEDHFFDQRLKQFCHDHDLKRRVLPSPNFLTSRKQFRQFLSADRRPTMARFYQDQRRRLQLLLEIDGSPRGGQWSFDADNRQRLPDEVSPPALPDSQWTDHTRDVVALVSSHFADHPGRADQFWWPVTRRSALYWVNDFIEHRLQQFGPLEDAMSQRSATLFHSGLSPMLNLGLITPQEILDRVLEHADTHDVALNSLEGFVRQIVGWREFVRGIYHEFDEDQRNSNFWGHHRGLTAAWYDGSTGIVPLDHAIDTVQKLGWSHHIQRLMVVGNLMTLCEIEPRQAHDWFMQTHVDALDWVMGPNVYGMALFSDGGIFATKPYICGSNYLRKMSDYGKGDWCDVVDGLYWRFIAKHRDFFSGHPRLAMMVGTLDRMGADRRQKLSSAAERFLDQHTEAP